MAPWSWVSTCRRSSRGDGLPRRSRAGSFPYPRPSPLRGTCSAARGALTTEATRRRRSASTQPRRKLSVSSPFAFARDLQCRPRSADYGSDAETTASARSLWCSPSASPSERASSLLSLVSDEEMEALRDVDYKRLVVELDELVPSDEPAAPDTKDDEDEDEAEEQAQEAEGATPEVDEEAPTGQLDDNSNVKEEASSKREDVLRRLVDDLLRQRDEERHRAAEAEASKAELEEAAQRLREEAEAVVAVSEAKMAEEKRLKAVAQRKAEAAAQREAAAALKLAKEAEKQCGNKLRKEVELDRKRAEEREHELKASRAQALEESWAIRTKALEEATELKEKAKAEAEALRVRADSEARAAVELRATKVAVAAAAAAKEGDLCAASHGCLSSAGTVVGSTEEGDWEVLASIGGDKKAEEWNIIA
mmetsp:Transcript_97163/g.313252  ORF Transcript_97163/g.313252 Transcript_97163/m.313252 type:complete len:422 (+) Transcript_97163:260-1525(+)